MKFATMISFIKSQHLNKKCRKRQIESWVREMEGDIQKYPNNEAFNDCIKLNVNKICDDNYSYNQTFTDEPKVSFKNNKLFIKNKYSKGF